MPDLVLPNVGRGAPGAPRIRRVAVPLRSASSGQLRRQPQRQSQSQQSSVDFRLLTEASLENREQQMRDALRLPPTAVVRPVSVQAANRAEASPVASRTLGIRSLVPRGSGVAAVRQQRESRQNEVQLPEVREAMNPRAELRQRLEEQEQALQRQLQEQAELQRQLQRHLEQEQQLQRELREELERELQDFSRLEQMVNNQGQTPTANAETQVSDVAAETLQSSSDRPPGDRIDMVEVPGIGPLPRQQLANLEALLNGQDVATGAENLPDLSGFSSAQLESLEAELSRGLMSTSPETRLTSAGADDITLPPQEPAGDPQVLSHPAETPQRQPPELMPREGGNSSTRAWRLKEAALEGLTVKIVPEMECSICCEMLKTQEVVALPCETRGCGSYFHAECIRPWLERNPSCPLCRDTLPQLVRPTTPIPQGTGNPLLDLWFLAMAMQRQERENITRRQSNGPSLADLQGVVFTASALVDLLSAHLGFDEDRGPGDLEDGPNLDMALQAMLMNNLPSANREDPRPQSSEGGPTLQPVLRPVNSFQEQILRSAAAMELRSDPRSPQR